MPPAMSWDLLCSAVSFAYGPAAKAVAVAARARELGLTTAFVGSGIALELAQRSESFCDCVDSSSPESSRARVLRAARRVLCVMDSAVASEARELGCDVTVADSLFWLWDRVPPAYLAADTYFVQAFPGVRERASELDRPPTIVGPIIDEPVRASTPSGRLVINLGGVVSPLGGAECDPYAELIVSAVADSALGKRYAGRILLIGGGACVDALTDQLALVGIEGASLAPEAARNQIGSAELLLTSPGLTTTLAAFAAAVPTLFLPPQNYSQWLILAQLRELALAPYAVHWRDCDPDTAISAGMPEGNAGREVRRTIARLALNACVRAALRDRLGDTLALDLNGLSARQHQWYRTLGTNGADSIARALAEAM